MRESRSSEGCGVGGRIMTAVCREWREGEEEAARQAAWDEYFERHPEILVSWAHRHGYWPPTATLTGK